MIRDYFEDFSRYTCAHDHYGSADAVIVGLPFDGTTSHHPGTRFGPAAIRAASWTVETYSPDLSKDLVDLSLCDLMDMAVYGTQEEFFRNIRTVAGEVAAEGKKVVALGGEHSVTYPLVQGVKEALGDLTVLCFDAHLDLRDEYLGNRLSHACVARRCLEVTPHFYHFGVRSGEAEEWRLAEKLQVSRRLPGREDIEAILAEDRPLYVTVDIDVLDPAFAPGTGAPEPGGVSSRELLQALHLLREAGDRLVAFDVVEVCPPCEHGTLTAALAAKVARELLLMALG
ncbi:MAG TPA: agmatinase [Thermoplasmatales archaeon]|nr:agmatinase [Thermoplasmatales archaeon]